MDLGNGSKTMFQCETCSNFFTDMTTFRNHQCCTQRSENPLSTTEGTQSVPSQLVWNKAQTQFLINSYQGFQNKVSQGKLKKKSMWESISEELKEQGHNFTPDQVCGRWKTLVRAYKNVKAHNSKSGSSLKVFQFETELDEIFANDPIMEPVKILSSSTSSSSPEIADSEEPNESRPPKKKPKSGSQQMVQLFQNFVSDQFQRDKEEAERVEKRHQERMALMTSLVDAIKHSSSGSSKGIHDQNKNL